MLCRVEYFIKTLIFTVPPFPDYKVSVACLATTIQFLVLSLRKIPTKMSSRKKLKNHESFHFEENDVLPAPSASALQKRKSVQERLAPKAGTLSHYGGGGRGGLQLHPRTSVGHGRPFSPTRGPFAPGSLIPGAVGDPRVQSPLNNNYYPPPPKPRTAPSTAQVSPDPVLDNIVAKLKAGLSLSESGVGGGGDCLCERSTKLVLCQLCGATYPGRTALRCFSHPRKIFLQDLQRCKVCQAGNLDNLKEFDLPPGMKETLGKVRKV